MSMSYVIRQIHLKVFKIKKEVFGCFFLDYPLYHHVCYYNDLIFIFHCYYKHWYPTVKLRLWLLVYEYGLSMYKRYNYELHFLKLKFILFNFFIYLKLKFWTFNDKIKWLNLKIKWSLQNRVIIAFWERGDFIYVNLYSSTNGIFSCLDAFLDHN